MCWANKVSAAKLLKLVPIFLERERKGYVCGRALLNLQFFGKFDLLRRVEVGGDLKGDVFTLGDDAGGESVVEDSFTLGSVGRTEEVEVGFEVLDGTC